jgi:hypothetical protein
MSRWRLSSTVLVIDHIDFAVIGARRLATPTSCTRTGVATLRSGSGSLAIIRRDGAMSDARPSRRRPQNRRERTLVNFTTSDGFRYIAGLGYFDDGCLAEIFLNAEKIGTAIKTAARDSAVVASLALQHGVPAETMRRALTRNGNGKASGPLGTLLDSLASENG